jgi:Family of unknown function (DUF6596)
VVYLLFNEGYLSTGDSVQSRDLTDDAEFLAGMLHTLMPTEPEVTGNDTAITRNAVRSRRCGSPPLNCHATAAAEDTSITESKPNPIRAVDDAIVPAVNRSRDASDARNARVSVASASHVAPTTSSPSGG